MRTLVLFAATLLLLPGCTGSQLKPKEPKATARSTARSATLPPMPTEAAANTQAGAIAFVKHYIDVFNYASNTGDVKELQRLSDPSCEGCNEYIDLYRKTYADGGYFKDSDWRLSDISSEIQGGIRLVFADMAARTGTYKIDSSSSVKVSRSDSAKLAFQPRHSRTAWVLQALELQKDER